MLASGLKGVLGAIHGPGALAESSVELDAQSLVEGLNGGADVEVLVEGGNI